MSRTQHADAVALAAEFLDEGAESLVATWIEWVRAHVATQSARTLPERALRNHLPPVIRSLASYIRSPLELVREELQGHLRLHGQIRRDQGYSLKEVVAEFDGLADIVSDGVTNLLRERHAELDPVSMLSATTRLAGGLRSVSFIAMGAYDDSDGERRQSMSSGLEDFARAIEHELRNPLNSIHLSLQVLRSQPTPDDDWSHHLDVMEAAVRRSSGLLDTVRMLAVAEKARAGAHLCSLEAALRRMCEEYREDASAAGVELEIRGKLPAVDIESVLLYVVLANLIGNAIKYSDPSKKKRWVRISARIQVEKHDADFCELAIEDNGLGIPEEHVSRVFQRGFRAHPDHAEGTGLGLHLTQKVLHERGGGITVESTAGKGTRFVALLRCLHGDASALTADRFAVEYLMGNSTAKPPARPDAAKPGSAPGT